MLPWCLGNFTPFTELKCNLREQVGKLTLGQRLKLLHLLFLLAFLLFRFAFRGDTPSRGKSEMDLIFILVGIDSIDRKVTSVIH